MPDFVAKIPPEMDENPEKKGLLSRLFSVLLSFYVNRRVLPAAYRPRDGRFPRNEVRQQFLRSNPHAKRRSLETPDHKLIDAMEIWHEEAEARHKNKWIVYFPGNGEQYEDFLKQALSYQKELAVNVLVFNYRGVGDSQGPVTPEGIDLDAITVLQYVIHGLKCQAKDLLVIGHSLGGGVAAKALAHFPEAGFCVERSFSSLHHTARSWIGFGVIGRVAAWIVSSCGWSLNSIQNWHRLEHGRKWMVYHKEDRVLPYVESQLHYALATQKEAASDERLEDIEMTSLWAFSEETNQAIRVEGELSAAAYEKGVHMLIDPHSQALEWDPPLWEQHLSNIRKALLLS